MGLGCFMRFAEFILVQVAASQRRRKSFFFGTFVSSMGLEWSFSILVEGVRCYISGFVGVDTIDFDWILKQHHGLTA
jgi:hypothetical protein